MNNQGPTPLNGFHLSWERIGVAVITMGATGILWTILGLTTKADMAAHNVSAEAHPIAIEDGVRPMPELVKNHEKAFQALSSKLNNTGDTLTKVQDAVYDDRAERLADIAADKVTETARSRQVWSLVKEKARSNLDLGKPIRHELERYLE